MRDIARETNRCPENRSGGVKMSTVFADSRRETSKMLTKKEIMEVVKRVPRFNFNGSLYLSMTVEALERYKKVEIELGKVEKTVKQYNKEFSLREEMKKNHIIVITFAAMFLESAIWDYAAINTSQNLAEEHLSKLDLVGKWKVVPKLVNGRDVSIGSKAIELLKKLNKGRNKIVHSKSKPAPDDFDKLREIVQEERMLLTISVEEAVQCIAECINELQRIDKKWWFFSELKGHSLIGRILLPGFNVT